MVSNPDKILLGVVIMFVFGLIVGLLNSVLVVKAKLDLFVVTLGMSIVLTGVTLVITKAPIGPSPKILRVLANQDIYGIPYVLFLIILLTVVFGILMRYTSLGRSFYAVGENPKGSYWAGLPVQKTQFMSFIISSLMAVVASLFLMGRTGAEILHLDQGWNLLPLHAHLSEAPVWVEAEDRWEVLCWAYCYCQFLKIS